MRLVETWLNAVASHLAANPPQRIIILCRKTGNVVDAGCDYGVGRFIPMVAVGNVLRRSAPRDETFFE
jgi:hypothetical protein